VLRNKFGGFAIFGKSFSNFFHIWKFLFGSQNFIVYGGPGIK